MRDGAGHPNEVPDGEGIEVRHSTVLIMGMCLFGAQATAGELDGSWACAGSSEKFTVTVKGTSYTLTAASGEIGEGLKVLSKPKGKLAYQSDVYAPSIVILGGVLAGAYDFYGGHGVRNEEMTLYARNSEPYGCRPAT